MPQDIANHLAWAKIANHLVWAKAAGVPPAE